MFFPQRWPPYEERFTFANQAAQREELWPEYAGLETPAGPIQAQCDAVPLATRYRWRIKVEGVDDGFRLGASTAAPLVTIDKVKPTQIVEVQVQAANGSQGVASETVRVILSTREMVVVHRGFTPVPVPEAKRASSEHGAAPLGEPPGARNGNGAVSARG